MNWFIMSGDEISGPFNEDHVKSVCDENNLIWGLSMSEWLNKASWLDHLKNPVVVEVITKKEPVAASEAHTEEIKEEAPLKPEVIIEQAQKPIKLEKDSESIKWYYASNKEKFGPFDETELIQMLKMLSFSEPVYLWHKGIDGWKALETFPNIHVQITNSKAA